MRLLLTLILLTTLSYALETTSLNKFMGCEYTVDGDIKVKWDASDNAEFYELGLVWIDVTPNVEYDLGRTSELEFVVIFPRSGQFIVRVRAGKYDTATEQEVFSEWSESINADVALVDGEPMAWRVQKIIKAPTW